MPWPAVQHWLKKGCFPVKVRQNTPSEYIIVQMTASYLLMTSGTAQASITSHEYDHFEPSLLKICAKQRTIFQFGHVG